MRAEPPGSASSQTQNRAKTLAECTDSRGDIEIKGGATDEGRELCKGEGRPQTLEPGAWVQILQESAIQGSQISSPTQEQ